MLVGELDIILYCDDVKDMEEFELYFFDVLVLIEGKEVILVDDVLYMGWIICVVMDVVMDLGCLRKIFLVVLVDCGYWELLICVDYVGKNILILKIEEIIVEMEECDGVDCIMISKGNE